MSFYRNWLGCCSPHPPVITAVDEPSSGLKIQGRIVKKASISSEDSWSNSACEIDNCTFQSETSMSSISSSNQPPDPSTEFMNHGLLLWNQLRQQWTDKKGSKTCKKSQKHNISLIASYESDPQLGENKPFPTPIQLPEMINFLADIWKQEEWYD